MFQGVDLQAWQAEEREAELRPLLQQKEQKLKQLRDGQRVYVEEIEVPEDGEPDREVRLTPKNRSGGRGRGAFRFLTVCLFVLPRRGCSSRWTRL